MSSRVRLNKKAESKLGNFAPILKTGKVKRKTPYELVEDLLDRGGSGRGDLSSNNEEVLRKRFKKNRP